jgi:hypothetical protein
MIGPTSTMGSSPIDFQSLACVSDDRHVIEHFHEAGLQVAQSDLPLERSRAIGYRQRNFAATHVLYP